MKKTLLLVALAAIAAVGVFAQATIPPFGFSVGGGVLFDGGSAGGVTAEASGLGVSLAHNTNVNHFGFGAWVFADATFAELSVAFMGGPASLSQRYSVRIPAAIAGLLGTEESFRHSETTDGAFAAMDVSLLGKLPIKQAGGNIAAFPLLGVGFSVILSSEEVMRFDGATRPASHLNTFRIQLGGGADFGITSRLFVRGSVLGYYRFPTRFFRDIGNDVNEWANGIVGNIPGVSSDTRARGGFGGTAKLAVGYRF